MSKQNPYTEYNLYSFWEAGYEDGSRISVHEPSEWMTEDEIKAYKEGAQAGFSDFIKFSTNFIKEFWKRKNAGVAE